MGDVYNLPKQNDDGSYNIETERYGTLGVPIEIFIVIKDLEKKINFSEKRNKILALKIKELKKKLGYYYLK